MATYDGIILDQDGLSIGDTVPLGTVVPSSTPAQAVNLTAEIFAVQTTGEGLGAGSLSISITGATISPCYYELAPPVTDFDTMGSGSMGYTPYGGGSFVAVCFALESYVFGVLPATAAITINATGGYGPFDTGGVRLIIRQFTGLDYNLGGAPGPQPPGSAIDISQPDPHSGAVTPSSFSIAANQEFFLITGFGPEEYREDGIGGTFPIDSGPATIALDDVIWDYGHNKAFSSVDTTPSSPHTVPLAFTDPGGGSNVYRTVSESIRGSSLVTGADPPACGAAPPGQYAIFASVGGTHITSPAAAGLMDPGSIGIVSTMGHRPKLGVVEGLCPFTGLLVRIDGVESGPYAFTLGDVIRNLLAGSVVSSNPPGVGRELDNIKVGTSDGGSNVFSAHFASAVVPPFDSTTGTGISATGGVMVVSNAGTNAYAAKDLGADYTSLSLVFDVKFDAVEIDNFASGTICAFSSPTDIVLGTFLLDPTVATWAFFSNMAFSYQEVTTPPVTADTWHTIELVVCN